jgi:uncharacterized protein (TIGR02646 family)
MPLRPEYIFRIGVVYTRTAVDDTEIVNDNAVNLKWKDGYKTFKPRIRNHLKIQQRGRCAFCRCMINEAGGYTNLEHIVAKDHYPQYQFLPENFVNCCWKCNRAKGRKNTINNPIINKTLQQFPTNSAGFVIVNPYHDDYQTHIDFIDEVIIIKQGNSTKGEKTIEFYNLSRPELAEERAREFKLNQQNINQLLLSRLASNTTDILAINQINAIIANMPNWTI